MPKKISEMNFAVIDDMSAVRTMVKDHLTDLGIREKMLFNDGRSALNQFKQTLVSDHNKFDFIISDWNMPKVKGIDVLKWVRSSPGYSEVPFMMLTAEADILIVKEAIEHGVDSYVVKPWTFDSFKVGLQTAYDKWAKRTKAVSDITG